jgi:hypothetical protein
LSRLDDVQALIASMTVAEIQAGIELARAQDAAKAADLELRLDQA